MEINMPNARTELFIVCPAREMTRRIRIIYLFEWIFSSDLFHIHCGLETWTWSTKYATYWYSIPHPHMASQLLKNVIGRGRTTLTHSLLLVLLLAIIVFWIGFTHMSSPKTTESCSWIQVSGLLHLHPERCIVWGRCQGIPITLHSIAQFWICNRKQHRCDVTPMPICNSRSNYLPFYWNRLRAALAQNKFTFVANLRKLWVVSVSVFQHKKC